MLELLIEIAVIGAVLAPVAVLADRFIHTEEGPDSND